MKASHKQIIKALMKGCWLSRNQFSHKTYELMTPGSPRWMAQTIRTSTIDEMRVKGLLVLQAVDGASQLRPSGSAILEATGAK